MMIKSSSLVFLGLIWMLTGCGQMNEKETEVSAGLNGGFEVVKNGLPVNWLLYTPQTVPDADFTLELDDVEYKEGRQSLRFDVKECTAHGGWKSPGFTNEFFEVGPFEGPGTYKLSFWTKNQGTTFRIRAGGVSPKKGEMKVLVESDAPSADWTFHEYLIEIPKGKHLRMELSILQPGTFWIDGVEVEKG